MASAPLLLLLCLLSFSTFPYSIYAINPIDSCWRKDPNWASNRHAFADCSVGFGKNATGGKAGKTYEVTDPSDDPMSPKPGTLRHGATQVEALWISFTKDMVITLKSELKVNSFKTIDGRGAKVEIANGPCIVVDSATNVIIHGISINNCVGGGGDAISVISSSHVWIDHCSLSRAADGLLDVTRGSTAVTISNNLFTNHDKVMLLGHVDNFDADKNMKVTVAFNHFGSGLVQRMPRVRMGYVHVANNRHDGWGLYAIGGSSNPTILSEGNNFSAPNETDHKEVTKRQTEEDWKNWLWVSSKDVFVNGAFFVASGSGTAAPNYTESQSFTVADGSEALALTADAGPLSCAIGQAC
ncbi:putative pectate lyase 2 [Malania oleifera]|uniref:putative pectate lyase 2 n=1 Tax=Malania oleifera TaxID=397392 RepID=UPI0025AE84B0|nr:putative pectate lyase 2 [Malania oleifera]